MDGNILTGMARRFTDDVIHPASGARALMLCRMPTQLLFICGFERIWLTLGTLGICAGLCGIRFQAADTGAM